MNTDTSFRIEHDLIGEYSIPADAYYGVHSLRAKKNFHITGIPIHYSADFVNALAAVKKAAAMANRDVGVLDEERAGAIIRACDDIMGGQLHDQFIVDLVQGGAGTSTNMNANEVIANRALEILGHDKGDYEHIHPNEHVNFGQSTNDVYPTAIKIALWHSITTLLGDIGYLRGVFTTKADEFRDVIKMGRTQMQDAVPMTLGQEFNTYATMMRDGERKIARAQEQIGTINLGGTAIGTGITAHPDYAPIAVRHLREITGIPLVNATDLINATQDCGGFVEVSSALKLIAVRLSKIANDLRLLSSGPRTGFDDIDLPAVQAGSSIMPGKVNPVIPEVVNQVAFEVIGNDATVVMAAEAGQLQLNAFEPIMAYSLFKSLRHLGAACRTLADNCVSGIRADADKLRERVTHSIGIVTALNPYIGYANATEIAKTAHETGGSVYNLVLERGLLSREQLDAILEPNALTHPVPLDLAPRKK